MFDRNGQYDVGVIHDSQQMRKGEAFLGERERERELVKSFKTISISSGISIFETME